MQISARTNISPLSPSPFFFLFFGREHSVALKTKERKKPRSPWIRRTRAGRSGTITILPDPLHVSNPLILSLLFPGNEIPILPRTQAYGSHRQCYPLSYLRRSVSHFVMHIIRQRIGKILTLHYLGRFIPQTSHRSHGYKHAFRCT